jgi:hypothetical protein
MSPSPSIGRIVHYTASCGDTGPYAGIIVKVTDPGPAGVVTLVTFGEDSFYHNRDVPFSAEPQPGHWSWPPRVG